MTQDEMAKLRATSEIAKNYRRQNERLREALGQYTQSLRSFDSDNKELFEVVHKNHRRNKDYVNY